VDQTGCLYLAANTPSEGFLYELAPRKEQNPENPEEGKRVSAKWTEIHHANHRNYTALQTFAVVRQFFTLFFLFSWIFCNFCIEKSKFFVLSRLFNFI
jgi:hypothetical protein